MPRNDDGPLALVRAGPSRSAAACVMKGTNSGTQDLPVERTTEDPIRVELVAQPLEAIPGQVQRAQLGGRVVELLAPVRSRSQWPQRSPEPFEVRRAVGPARRVRADLAGVSSVRRTQPAVVT